MKTFLLLVVGVLGLAACSDTVAPSTPVAVVGQTLLSADVGTLTQDDILAIERAVQPLEQMIARDGIAASRPAIREAIAEANPSTPRGAMTAALLAERVLDAAQRTSSASQADLAVASEAADILVGMPGVRSTLLSEFLLSRRSSVEHQKFESAARLLIASAQATPMRPCTGCTPEQARVKRETQARFDASIAALEAAL